MRPSIYKSIGCIFLLFLVGQSIETYARQAQPPIQVEAKAAQVMQDGSSWWFQGDVRAVYGQQTLFAQELKLYALGKNEWRLEAQTQVDIQDPGFSGKADTLSVWLTQREETFAPTRLELTDFDVKTTGELGQLRYRARRGSLRFERALASVLLTGDAQVGLDAFTLRADTLSLTREQEERWTINAVDNVQFEGAEQTLNSERLSLNLSATEGQTRLESATLNGFGGAGVFTNALGERHDIRYEGARAAFTFEGDQLTRMTLEQARFTTCTCAETIEQASYSLSGREVTLWPDEWIFGREITLKASGVPLFWVPIFFAPLKEIEFEGSEFLPEIGRDVQRGWFARWRLPLFADPGNRGTFLFDYYHRFAETGLGVDWAYTLPLQTQSGRLRVYHLVGQHELLDVSWSHRWPISSLADLSWSLSRQQVTPSTAAPSRWRYNIELNAQLPDWQWRLSGARQESTQEEDERPPAFRVLERLPELSVSHSGRLFDLLQYGGSASWGHFREQRGAQTPFLERDRLDAAANLSLAQLTVQSASLRLGANAGVRYSNYGQGQARSSAQVQLDAQWTPLQDVSATARYLFRSLQGNSPFAFDALQVADALTGRLQFSWGGIQGSLSGGYGFGARRLDPFSLTLESTVGQHALRGVVRTRADGLGVDTVQLQHTWQADWGQWTAVGGYNLSANRFDDLIVKLSLETFRLGARIDLNGGTLRRTNAEFDLRLGRWALDFNGEYDWTLGRFSALQVGVVHHFCKDCWQAGVYLSGQRVWLQVQINAFPGAGLNYSPSDGALSFR